MDLSASSLLSNIIFGLIGFYIFREGKRRASFKLIILGILLMTYTYFTSGPWLDWGVGFALCAWAYYEITS